MSEVVVIAGMSGAGRSVAADNLEDLGWFVMDNLPPQLIPKVAELADGSGSGGDRLALVVGSGRFHDEVVPLIGALRHQVERLQLVFLDAKGERLVAPPLSVGMPLAERTLREAPPAQLASRIDQAKQRFASLPLGPGETRAFNAVAPVAQIPDEARRILLEIGEPHAAPTAAPVAARRSEDPPSEGSGSAAVGAQLDDLSD